MDYEKSFLNDPFMADELEKVPGGYFIEYSQIKNYVGNKPFKIMTDNGDELVEYNDKVCQSFNYYYEIFDNCERFGIPGGDWTKCESWILELVKMFDLCKLQVNNYTSERARA